MRDPRFQDEIISSKAIDIKVTIRKPFLTFGLQEAKPGEFEFYGRTIKNVLLEKGVDKIRDFYAANEDLILTQDSFPIRIIDQVTREQVLVDFSGRDDGLASIGAKPLIPKPTLSATVALAEPK